MYFLLITCIEQSTFLVLSVLYVKKQVNCFVLLTGECFYSEPGLTVLRSASIVLRKFCPLCYKHVIAVSPRRIKDKFSLVFSKFSQIALVAARLGQFAKTLKIQVKIIRLHILLFKSGVNLTHQIGNYFYSSRR